MENKFGYGPNAMISWGGPDRSKCHLVARSVIEFLEGHLLRL